MDFSKHIDQIGSLLLEMFKVEENFKVFNYALDFLLQPFTEFPNKALDTTLSHYVINHISAIILEFQQLIYEIYDQFPYTDIIGMVYNKYVDVGFKSGRFFSPPSLGLLLSALIYDKPIGVQFFHEPAVGSGALILPFAKSHKETLFFVADKNELCCKMCLLNMLMNGIVGEIAHMDTLSLTFYKVYYICADTYDKNHCRLFYKESRDSKDCLMLTVK